MGVRGTGRQSSSRGRRRERKEAGSAANDESNKTRADGRFGQIGRPFNWEFDEFMDFLICHYGRPFTNSPSSLDTPLSLILPVPVEGAKIREKEGAGHFDDRYRFLTSFLRSPPLSLFFPLT